MKNNKAFTLIELLAVVSILIILSLIIISLIDKNLKRAKEQAYQTQIENIRIAAQTYYSDNILLKPQEGASAIITLEQLINSGYMGNNIKNPKTGTAFQENIYVKLQNINGKFEYKVCPIETCN